MSMISILTNDRDRTGYKAAFIIERVNKKLKCLPVIVKLTIPPGAELTAYTDPRYRGAPIDYTCNGLTYTTYVKKRRCSEAHVDNIYLIEKNEGGGYQINTSAPYPKKRKVIHSYYQTNYSYRNGSKIKPWHPFSHDPVTCDSGIHFFDTAYEALAFYAEACGYATINLNSEIINPSMARGDLKSPYLRAMFGCKETFKEFKGGL